MEPQNDVCWSCGDQLIVPTLGPALCPACQEAGELWPEIKPTLNAALDLGRCRNCGGAHHIQKCAEILDLLLAPDDESPTSDSIGPDSEPGRALFRWRGTAREWLAKKNRMPFGVR